MEETGELEKTVIFLYSDHGDHMLYPFIKFQSGESERYNPFMFILSPHEKIVPEMKELNKNL